MGERTFWIEMRAGSPIMVWVGGGCRSATQPELELSDALAAAEHRLKEANARLAAAEKLSQKWKTESHKRGDNRSIAADELEAALTPTPDPARDRNDDAEVTR